MDAFAGGFDMRQQATPYHESNCHCSICRRTTGAPFVTWFSVLRSQFRLVCGEPTRFRSTTKGTRSFCPRCGPQLIFEHEDSWKKSTSRRAALMTQIGCRRRTTHKRVASSAGSNWPISYANTKKVGRKGDVMLNPLIVFATIPADQYYYFIDSLRSSRLGYA